jgi:hypothetical protein
MDSELGLVDASKAVYRGKYYDEDIGSSHSALWPCAQGPFEVEGKIQVIFSPVMERLHERREVKKRNK